MSEAGPVPPRGRGRPKGSKNKTPQIIKEMVLTALDKEGGVKYFRKLAQENPTAFVTLVAKILPTQITGANDGPVQVEKVERVVVQPPNYADDPDS
ncbi:MAG TPA: hypothetical protein VMU59_07395 [Caulobacteraceae bacterium]|nr:hypothetical protein [Caulobacteraceae bacterium]